MDHARSKARRSDGLRPFHDFPRLKIEYVPTFHSDHWLRKTILTT
jgi:hypothetical protein